MTGLRNIGPREGGWKTALERCAYATGISEPFTVLPRTGKASNHSGRYVRKYDAALVIQKLGIERGRSSLLCFTTYWYAVGPQRAIREIV